jgi:phage terminase large subunit GpA-like protein
MLGVDVGDHYVHWTIAAVRQCEAIHVVDYGINEVPLKSRSLRDAISSCIEDIVIQSSKGFIRDGSTELMPLWSAYIDTGHQPDAIFEAIKRVSHACRECNPVIGRGFNQIHGRNYTQPAKTGNVVRELDKAGRWYLSRVRRAGIDQITADTDSIRLLMLSGLILQLSTPGSISLFAGPASIHRKFAKQLTSEQLITTEVPGQPSKTNWECHGANHYGDSLVYALLAALRNGWTPSKEMSNDDEINAWSPQ